MEDKVLEQFRELLQQRRNDLLNAARKMRLEDMALDQDDLPDEMDLATSEYNQALTFRLRGREKTLIKKIDEALGRMDAGEFGLCEDCGEEISDKRLRARPVTTLCIQCKEEQEKAEKSFR